MIMTSSPLTSPLYTQLDQPTVRQCLLERLATVQDYIRFAVSAFEVHDLSYGQGTENSYDEAVFLVLRSLHLPPDLLEPVLKARVLPEESALILDRIHARCQGMPLAYVMGETYLQGMHFLTDPEVIIPRSPIAEIIMNADSLLPELMEQDIKRGLDMCTGSGCLAIMAAIHWGIFMDAVDISPRAIELSELNIDKYDLWDMITLHQNDGLKGLNLPPLDVILCNPPYVCDESMDELPDEFRHEPELALRGGKDGMDFIRTFLPECGRLLHPNGMLILEIGNEYNTFIEVFPKLDHSCIVSSVCDNNSVLKISGAQLRHCFG